MMKAAVTVLAVLSLVVVASGCSSAPAAAPGEPRWWQTVQPAERPDVQWNSDVEQQLDEYFRERLPWLAYSAIESDLVFVGEVKRLIRVPTGRPGYLAATGGDLLLVEYVVESIIKGGHDGPTIVVDYQPIFGTSWGNLWFKDGERLTEDYFRKGQRLIVFVTWERHWDWAWEWNYVGVNWHGEGPLSVILATPERDRVLTEIVMGREIDDPEYYRQVAESVEGLRAAVARDALDFYLQELARWELLLAPAAENLWAPAERRGGIEELLERIQQTGDEGANEKEETPGE